MIENKKEFSYTRDDFDFLRKISNEYSGILVPDHAFDMFYSRLVKRLRIRGFTNFKDYCDFLKNNHSSEFTEFINSITTNLTSFYREKQHFEYLENFIIPELLQRNSSTKTIRAWSAGCSTGEEAYSLAITLLENVPNDWKIKILATDLDTNVLQTAANGIYSADRVQGLSTKTLKKWFKKGKGNNANKVKISKECQHLIIFKQLNLMQEWPIKNCFDFIFCRNVLIYFDLNTKRQLAHKYGQLLTSGSHLFIGHSESLLRMHTDFELIRNTIYKKV